MLVRIENKEDHDQIVSEAIWSGSALFVKSFLADKCFEILEHLL